MSLDFESQDFSGHLLAAMPALQHATFGGSLVLVCAHSADGAMGLIINRTTSNRQVPHSRTDIVEMLAQRGPLFEGGPAETNRPFVLHSPDWADAKDTLAIGDRLAMTASSRALTAVATGEGPENALIALGYSAWGAGQLESELLGNVWLSLPADPSIVFDVAPPARWGAAIRSMGAVPEGLSGAMGRA